mmetsp:Transcript_2222/g.6570  ORF Transcript_2222/g.6570 Transcript_2222/m.6570 type:complete len:90 (-) Transcript_2222:916-1185(-)
MNVKLMPTSHRHAFAQLASQLEKPEISSPGLPDTTLEAEEGDNGSSVDAEPWERRVGGRRFLDSPLEMDSPLTLPVVLAGKVNEGCREG